MSDNELGIIEIRIVDASKINDYLFLTLENGQKILINGKELYDLSEFEYVKEIFKMQDRLCAVLYKDNILCLIDLNTKEVLFQDSNAYAISKHDERTLHVIMNIGAGNNTIYDIERKMYLPMPDDYEFENSLGNGLYVFCENNSNLAFYERKRCVINSNGVFVLKDIQGWIYLEDGYLIVRKNEELTILELDEEAKVKSIKNIKKDDTILTAPKYCEGKIIIVLKDKVNVYKPSLELLRTIPVAGLRTVSDSEMIGDILKLAVPTIYNNELCGKHIFVNVVTGKIISHLRINGYPYWTQDTFVGQDELDLSGNDLIPIDFYFYDKDFNFITKERGTACYSADDENESLFVVEDNEKQKLINAKNGSIKETDYIIIRYHYAHSYGYGIHKDNKTMDFFDDELNVIIPNFEFAKYNLNFIHSGFGYFIVNGYVCITKHFVDGTGRSKYRNAIYSANDGLVLDSVEHRCYSIGDFIQIIEGKDSKFLNTLTGEFEDLSIKAPVSESGKIDFSRINNVNNILGTRNNKKLGLPTSESGTSRIREIHNKKLEN